MNRGRGIASEGAHTRLGVVTGQVGQAGDRGLSADGAVGPVVVVLVQPPR